MTSMQLMLPRCHNVELIFPSSSSTSHLKRYIYGLVLHWLLHCSVYYFLPSSFSSGTVLTLNQLPPDDNCHIRKITEFYLTISAVIETYIGCSSNRHNTIRLLVSQLPYTIHYIKFIYFFIIKYIQTKVLSNTCNIVRCT